MSTRRAASGSVPNDPKASREGRIHAPTEADSRAPGPAGLRAFRVAGFTSLRVAGLGALQAAGLRVESVAGLIGICSGGLEAKAENIECLGKPIRRPPLQVPTSLPDTWQLQHCHRDQDGLPILGESISWRMTATWLRKKAARRLVRFPDLPARRPDMAPSGPAGSLTLAAAKMSRFILATGSSKCASCNVRPACAGEFCRTDVERVRSEGAVYPRGLWWIKHSVPDKKVCVAAYQCCRLRGHQVKA